MHARHRHARSLEGRIRKARRDARASFHETAMFEFLELSRAFGRHRDTRLAFKCLPRSADLHLFSPLKLCLYAYQWRPGAGIMALTTRTWPQRKTSSIGPDSAGCR